MDPVDPSNTVVRSYKIINSAPWAGTSLGEGGLLAEQIPFTSDEQSISVRIYSEHPGSAVHLKAEDANDPAFHVESRMYTTKTNEWETLVFDFSNEVFGSPPLSLNTEYYKLSLFFDFGTPGTNEQKYFYWDDIKMGGESTTLGQLDLPVTFEEEGISYALVDFENNQSQIGLDPEDASNTVAMSTKTIFTSAWSGTVIGTRNGFVNELPFSMTDTKVRMKVYSPEVNTPILLKAESIVDPNFNVVSLQYTTVANEWEVIEWDFLQHLPNSPALDLTIDYYLLAVFFNFGIDGATSGEQNYYWDDVEFASISNTDEIHQIQITIYPNPAQHYLEINSNEEIDDLTILNIKGQEVLRRDLGHYRNKVDISPLISGNYFLVLSKNGKKMVKQFTKD